MRRVEGVHSDLLAWLLDPHGWHGLGDAFGRHFIPKALRAAGCQFSGSFAIAKVETEASTGEGPIDVLVHLQNDGRSIVVGIENKIDAPVGGPGPSPSADGPGLVRRIEREGSDDEDQLARDARRLGFLFGSGNAVLVLLAPTEREIKLSGA